VLVYWQPRVASQVPTEHAASVHVMLL